MIQTPLLPENGISMASIQPNPEASRINNPSFHPAGQGGVGATTGLAPSRGGGSWCQGGAHPRPRPKSHTSGPQDTHPHPRAGVPQDSRPYRPRLRPPSPLFDQYSRPRRYDEDQSRYTYDPRLSRPHLRPPSPLPDQYGRPPRYAEDQSRYTNDHHLPRDRTPSPRWNCHYTPERRCYDHSPEQRPRQLSRKN